MLTGFASSVQTWYSSAYLRVCIFYWLYWCSHTGSFFYVLLTVHPRIIL